MENFEVKRTPIEIEQISKKIDHDLGEVKSKLTNSTYSNGQRDKFISEQAKLQGKRELLDELLTSESEVEKPRHLVL